MLFYEFMVIEWFWWVGGVLVGKINLDEFVMGGFIEMFVFGVI